MAKEKIVKDNAERWLLTYADLMNLLLILFIILYSMSQVDSQKFQQLSQSLSAAFGTGTASVINGGGAGNSLINFPATMPSPVIPSTMEQEQMEVLEGAISEMIEEKGLDGKVNAVLQDRGIVVSIDESLLFKSGSATVEKKYQEPIIKIGKDILSKIPNKHIRIEGHTDDVPINTYMFPSNWELSTSRATNVLRLLLDKANLNPKMISAVGYGEYVPLVKNDSDKNRETNRRVSIVILRDSSSKGEASTDK